MTAEEWIKENEMFIQRNSFRPEMIAHAAFNAGQSDTETTVDLLLKQQSRMVFRTDYDADIDICKKQTAAEIITLIIEWEGAWSVLDFKDAIKEKFGLEI